MENIFSAYVTQVKFFLNHDLIVLTFNRNWAVSFGMSNENKILNLKVFDFVNKTYTKSGHYLDELRSLFHNYLYVFLTKD